LRRAARPIKREVEEGDGAGHVATYFGTTGDDTFTGGSDDDLALGDAGNDHLSGGDGDDDLEGEDGDDVLSGDAGDDWLYGGAGNDRLEGGAGFDLLQGEAGNDILIGGDGNDLLIGGPGVDSFDGGSQDPTAFCLPWGDTITFREPRATQGVVADLRTGQISNDGFGNVETMTGIEAFSGGTAFADFFYGNDAPNRLVGGRGDTVMGFGGDDVILVGRAPALANGGDGIDSLLLGASGELIPNPNGGSVAVIAPGMSAGYTIDLAAGVLTDPYGNTGSVAAIERVTGTGFDDVLLGSGGDDWVAPGFGSDTIDGRGGTDTVSYAGSNHYAYWYNYQGGVFVDLAGGHAAETYYQHQTTGSGASVRAAAPTGRTGPGDTPASVDGLAGEEIVEGTGLGDTIYGDDGDNLFRPGAGNDLVDGRGGNDTVDYGSARAPVSVSLQNGTATESGTGETTFDALDGQFGTTVQADDYAATTDQLIGIENAIGSAFADLILGDGGANRLEGGGGNDLLDGGAGKDTLVGGAGDDTYYVDSLEDVVTENAGEGTDEVRTYASGYVLPGNVEKLTFIGSGAGDIRGNSGDNVLTGGSAGDFLRLQDGGDDTADMGGGNDAVYFGAAMTAADNVDGGDGKDVVALQGNYSGLTLGADSLRNVETLSILTHTDTRFGGGSASGFSYVVTLLDAAVAAGTQLIVNASTLEAGENLTFDAHLEGDGSVFVYGGKGVDTLTGGSGADVFFFAEDGRFAASDHVDGGLGNDILVLRGNYDLTLTAGSIVNVETVTLLSGTDARFYPAGTDFSYAIATDDTTVAAGQVMTFNGGSLRSSETLHFDGSAETGGGAFRVFGGAGDDTITGGGGADLIFGGLGADLLKGGAGGDTFRYQSVFESTASAMDRILDFASGDHVEMARAGHFAFIGSDAFGGHAGELRVEQQGTSNVWLVQADADGDRAADFVLEVTVADNHALAGSDFAF
jgi:Ca2+-binding RTX toxin-like protein